MTEETQALVAEWGEAVYLAREDYTVDPHQHIERLVQRGDYLVDALTTLARDLETARQERDAARASISEANSRLTRCQNALTVAAWALRSTTSSSAAHFCTGMGKATATREGQ